VRLGIVAPFLAALSFATPLAGCAKPAPVVVNSCEIPEPSDEALLELEGETFADDYPGAERWVADVFRAAGWSE